MAWTELTCVGLTDDPRQSKQTDEKKPYKIFKAKGVYGLRVFETANYDGRKGSLVDDGEAVEDTGSGLGIIQARVTELSTPND
ncbi:uncharacterized protein RCO7_15059 [Rhynchosporium graminicola]|uniref:Uncharacterized protein n=1 Tax=Rhynchosporium graminicola TaxID=2792576 RepID=A0A1E1LID0_9HELO|nr:uncharacterized protein RCO7_15059 [Rhynchosporium commune]